MSVNTNVTVPLGRVDMEEIVECRMRIGAPSTGQRRDRITISETLPDGRA
jgi:hypothetical protein